MATKTVRLDPRTERLLQAVLKRTGMTASDALKAGVAALHRSLVAEARAHPYAVYRALDLGGGGYARAPARDAKTAIRAVLRARRVP